jgi:hypothetical protein
MKRLSPGPSTKTPSPATGAKRVEEVLEAISKGAAEKMWSTYWQASELVWDHKRECWVDGARHAYDGARLYEYSRQGEGVSPIERLHRH